MLLQIIIDRNYSCLTDAVVKFAVSGILYSFLFLIFAAYGSCKNIKCIGCSFNILVALPMEIFCFCEGMSSFELPIFYKRYVES
jgi:hypothetical protein